MKTLKAKNVLTNSPPAAMSDRAPSSVFADLVANVSPVMAWRFGPMETLWQRLAGQISNLIVADRWKTTKGTRDGMFDCE